MESVVKGRSWGKRWWNNKKNAGWGRGVLEQCKLSLIFREAQGGAGQDHLTQKRLLNSGR